MIRRALLVLATAFLAGVALGACGEVLWPCGDEDCAVGEVGR